MLNYVVVCLDPQVQHDQEFLDISCYFAVLRCMTHCKIAKTRLCFFSSLKYLKTAFILI